MSPYEILGSLTVIGAAIFWLATLEQRQKRNAEKIKEVEGRLEGGDSRMTAIENRIVTALQTINSEMKDSAKSIAKIEGMLMYKDKIESRP